MSRGDFQAGAQAARRALGGMMAGKANYLVRAKNGAVFVTSTLAEAKKVEASGAAPAKRRRNPAKRGSAKRRNPSAAEHLKLGFESLSAAEKALKSYAAAGLNDRARQKIALHAMRSADLAYREFTHAGGSRAGYAAQIDAAHDALEEAQALLSHHLKHNPAKRRRNPSAAEHKKRGAEHLQNSMDFLLDFVPKLRRLQEQAGPKSGLYKPELRSAYSSALEAAALANQDFADAGMGYTGDRSLAISALVDARDGLIANPKAKRGSAKRRRNPSTVPNTIVVGSRRIARKKSPLTPYAAEILGAGYGASDPVAIVFSGVSGADLYGKVYLSRPVDAYTPLSAKDKSAIASLFRRK